MHNIINVSGLSLSDALAFFDTELETEKLVLFPDLTKGKAILPAGTTAVFDMSRVRDWRKYAIADVGCGMNLVKTTLTKGEFFGIKERWDQLFMKLVAVTPNTLGDLGTGNHFFDAVVDDSGIVYFLCHTGTPSSTPWLEDVVANEDAFDTLYGQKIAAAHHNREVIMTIASEIYPEFDFSLILDKEHNNFENKGNMVTIRKGTVTITPGEVSVMPSSMIGDVALLKGKNSITQLENTVSHGTGRNSKRGESNRSTAEEIQLIRESLYIPQVIKTKDILIEAPAEYRELNTCVSQIKEYITVEKVLKPIAYIGQLPRN